LIPFVDDDIVVRMADVEVQAGEPRTIRELLERMAEVLSAPDPHRVGIQEIIVRDEARRRDIGAVRETPAPYGADSEAQRLDRLEPAVAQVQRSIDELRHIVDEIRLRMATKVEVESVRDDIRKVADGYAHVSAQLQRNSELLKRFLTDSPR
jgi:hypothetical protein